MWVINGRRLGRFNEVVDRVLLDVCGVEQLCGELGSAGACKLRGTLLRGFRRLACLYERVRRRKSFIIVAEKGCDLEGFRRRVLDVGERIKGLLDGLDAVIVESGGLSWRVLEGRRNLRVCLLKVMFWRGDDCFFIVPCRGDILAWLSKDNMGVRGVLEFEEGLWSVGDKLNYDFLSGFYNSAIWPDRRAFWIEKLRLWESWR